MSVKVLRNICGMSLLGIGLSFSSSLYCEVLQFKNVNVITMEQELVLDNYQVIVNDGIITAIKPDSEVSPENIDRVIDGKGYYMLPGLSDTHFHQHGGDYHEYQLQFKSLIANGVTNVRSMAEWSEQDTIAIRYSANANKILAPYYYTTGPQLAHYNMKNPQDAINMVRFHKDRGYDFIKVHGDFDTETYFTLLREAEREGIPVTGHAQRKQPLEYSLRMYGLAHMEELVVVLSDEENLKIVDLDPETAKSIARQVKESGIFISPTLSIISGIQNYTDDAKFEKMKASEASKYISWKEYERFTNPDNQTYYSPFFRTEKVLKYVDDLIKANKILTKYLNDEGVPLLVGTDNYGFQITGFSIHDELQLMHEAGLSNYDVLKAATINSARFLKRLGTAGTISVGKEAEFILLSENPLSDIKNTKSIQGVMLRNQYFDRAGLDAMLDEVLKARRLEFEHAAQAANKKTPQ